MPRFLPVFFFIALFISLPITDAEAQYRSRKKRVKHRFNAGLSLGASFSQIDGDNHTGFNKAGIRAGVRGSMYLNPRLDLVVGFLFNQKGSALSIFNEDRGNVIHLDYMEVPLMLSFRTSKKDKNKTTLQAGFTYGRLINYSVKELIRDPRTDIFFSDLAKRFNSNEFSAIVGMDHFITQNIGIGFTYSFQINETYSNPLIDSTNSAVILSSFNNNATSKVLFLKNYQLSFHILYNIF